MAKESDLAKKLVKLTKGIDKLVQDIKKDTKSVLEIAEELSRHDKEDEEQEGQ